jgi:hypothetical protein
MAYSGPIEGRYPPNSSIVAGTTCAYIAHVNRLTRQEQMVLCVVVGLLLVGWTVKIYRAAHPRAPVVLPVAR